MNVKQSLFELLIKEIIKYKKSLGTVLFDFYLDVIKGD